MKKGLKKTPLYSEHLSLGAKMVDFHSWLMPVSYRGISNEVNSVRNKAGLFDLSHMGEIMVEGERAFAFLQFATANDVSMIKAGKMQYSFFLSEEGTVLDDFMLYHLQDKFMAVVNAGNTDKILKHLKTQKESRAEFSDGVKLIDATENLALIGIQGPKAEEILQKLTAEDLSKIKYFQTKEIILNGQAVLLSRSGYTGEDGFEIYAGNGNPSKLWRAILDKGRFLRLEPAGLAARDILRIEMGYPLYGQEWDETITPWEAGFSWAVKLNKDFLGKAALIGKKDGMQSKLIGFVMKEKAVPRQGYSIKEGERDIGRVTSGTFSPTRRDFVGMGYVFNDFAGAGGKINIEIRDKLMPAEIVKLPFVISQVKKIG